MSIDFNIDAEPRTDEGKGASRRLRRSGRIPAIPVSYTHLRAHETP